MKETFLCSVLFRLATQLIYIDDRNFAKQYVSKHICEYKDDIDHRNTFLFVDQVFVFFFSTYIELNRHAAEVDMP